jgi:hypothetical protein
MAHSVSSSRSSSPGSANCRNTPWSGTQDWVQRNSNNSSLLPRVMTLQRARSGSTGPLLAAPPGKTVVASRESSRVIRESIWTRSLILTMLLPTSDPLRGCGRFLAGATATTTEIRRVFDLPERAGKSPRTTPNGDAAACKTGGPSCQKQLHERWGAPGPRPVCD